jgi:hypothetical protein
MRFCDSFHKLAQLAVSQSIEKTEQEEDSRS